MLEKLIVINKTTSLLRGSILLMAFCCLLSNQLLNEPLLKFTPYPHDQTSLLSYNRYQIGSVCVENGWEFCIRWAYTPTRIA